MARKKVAAKTSAKESAKRKSRAKPKNQPAVEETAAVGCPSKYLPEYCDKLLEHCRKGKTYRSFAGDIGVHWDTLYEWERVYPEFSDARKRGLALLHLYYESMGQALATGQLRRVASEEPILGPNGSVMYDMQGKIVVRTTYESSRSSTAAWIFLTKNICGWSDKRDVTHSGSPDGAPIRVQSQSQEERMREIEELRKLREQCGDD